MKIIYIMDPLCGWCYGNSDNMLKLYDQYKNDLDFEILSGGMWTGSNVRKQSPQMVNFFLKHDEAVAERTGITFGEDYFELLKQEIVLDSEIPSRAMVSVKTIAPEKAVPFMIAIQKARYYWGKDLNVDATYLEICKNLGIDQEQFLAAFHSEEMKQATLQNFNDAAQYAQSFPTMLVEKDGTYVIIEQDYASFTELEKHIELLKNRVG
ncbi:MULTISPECIES: DsbA family protein [Chryseobacterium]|uniref:DsbA family protein n=1 Tax=Chryseobacterium TaxID=59732 RepID=UPI001E4BD645|nr:MULTISPECIES: DsbA family protein [Chryseobacterium]